MRPTRPTRTARWFAVFAGAFAAGSGVVLAGGCGEVASDNCTAKATCMPDATVDSTEDAGDCSACTLAPPAGWSLVAFAVSTTMGCPAGFTTMNVVEKPDGGTCTCGSCQATDPPSCASETFSSTVGAGCADAGATYPVTGGQCNNGQSTLGTSIAIPSAPVTGSCAATATGDPATMTYQSDRICVPPQECLACNPSLAPAFDVCLMASNAQTCPTGTTQQHLVSTAYALECTACNCTLSATCEGTLTLYENANCTGTAVSLLANGICASTSAMSVSSYAFDGGLSSTSCIPGTSHVEFQPTSPLTVCCP